MGLEKEWAGNLRICEAVSNGVDICSGVDIRQRMKDNFEISNLGE